MHSSSLDSKALKLVCLCMVEMKMSDGAYDGKDIL